MWGWQSAPARKYDLLVAGYFRSRGPLMVEGEGFADIQAVSDAVRGLQREAVA